MLKMKVSLVWLTISFVCLLPWYLLAQNSPKDYLKIHNAARAKVGVKSLKWSFQLEEYAQAHLTMYIRDCMLKLSPAGNPYGENIAFERVGSLKELTGAEAVRLWLVQKQYYDEKSNSCVGGDCLSYTQVVWDTTTYIGCARVKCNNGRYMVSCNYYPPGNYVLD
ncbi:hypothetical protein PIB30_118393 [Stylosanthes scabra]|uniref:SCP domain-containing protein n=1 Tax=Stylosanthes scabra TaxID=79078 RepID=A0ABU6UMF4_9FABA|nr:hypothetical protein [Stylosanthes scabra]